MNNGPLIQIQFFDVERFYSTESMFGWNYAEIVLTVLCVTPDTFLYLFSFVLRDMFLDDMAIEKWTTTNTNFERAVKYFPLFY